MALSLVMCVVANLVIQAMYEGLVSVIPYTTLELLSWGELEALICGAEQSDVRRHGFGCSLLTHPVFCRTVPTAPTASRDKYPNKRKRLVQNRTPRSSSRAALPLPTVTSVATAKQQVVATRIVSTLSVTSRVCRVCDMFPVRRWPM